MPPRHAYWTILIDDKPTAFRAREREELQPTLVQLQRKNANVTMRWFARGKLWDSREAEQQDFQTQKRNALEPRDRRAARDAGVERRGGDWRPGGTHKDPRDRFKKKNRPERAWSEKDPATQRDRDKPGYVAKKPWQKPEGVAARPRDDWRDKSGGAPRRDGGGRSDHDRKPWQNKAQVPTDRPWQSKRPVPTDRPWQNKPPVPNDRPWQTKPTGPRAQRKPWVGKPGPPGEGAGFKPRGDRPWNKPAGGPPRGDRPWTGKPSGERRPWQGKPPDARGGSSSGSGAPGRKPWQDKPAGGPPRGARPAGDHRTWTPKPAGGPPRGDRPWNKKPGVGGTGRDKPSSRGSERPWEGKPRDANRRPFTPGGRRPGDGPPRKPRDDED